ncbi:uncharacterized protein LOC133733524 [Rosa rugosa]|uniref:uncharacterized protein LOC133733524 n=1 Tax=Rosa rugosa TaxID=74645 RepID=UPI002B415A0D|nr:uncharacterized protein LOC133733524 [Rosa rugosa]
MGSLPSPPRPSSPPPSPTHSLSNYRVCATFCLREPSPNLNISNWIEIYDPSTNSWTHVTSIPGLVENHILKGFSMVSMGDSLYIIGGRLCHKELSHTSDECSSLVDMEVQVSSSVLRYDVATDQWSTCAPLGVARCDFACTVSDNKIYVAGGKTTLACARGISSAELYDPQLDKWIHMPNMSTLRYKCVGVTWQNKIYILGGFAEPVRKNSDVPPIMVRSSAEVYDTQTKKWELIIGMWQLDVPPNQIVDVGGRLFSSGDCFKQWKGHIESYDGELNIWNEVDGSHLHSLNSLISSDDEMWAHSQRRYLTMAPIGDHLYFLAIHGLMDNDLPRTMSIVHRFDTSATSNNWTSMEPMEEDREKELCGHACVVHLS